jgi:hypothetical protein
METMIDTPAAAPASAAPARDYSRCFFIGEYEDNGYHDSYFHVVFWNDTEGKTENSQFAATAYGGGWNYERDLQFEWPADVIARFRAYRLANARKACVDAENARVLKPGPAELTFGARVSFLKDSRKGGKNAYAKGQTGEIFWIGYFGTFYANGYQKPDRSNGRIGVRLANGEKTFAGMSVVRLAEDPDMEKAERNAQSAAAGPGACPHAWWTKTSPLLG